ncbi:hypothetical protein BJV78DRAFT_945120 [Lactifluus subvellereus]|nr:hypothetical protein BJV78DRAFT_945120 [Lactifluus subvellereus]
MACDACHRSPQQECVLSDTPSEAVLVYVGTERSMESNFTKHSSDSSYIASLLSFAILITTPAGSLLYSLLYGPPSEHLPDGGIPVFRVLPSLQLHPHLEVERARGHGASPGPKQRLPVELVPPPTFPNRESTISTISYPALSLPFRCLHWARNLPSFPRRNLCLPFTAGIATAVRSGSRYRLITCSVF